MNTLSKQNYIETLKKLEESPSYRIGTLGVIGIFGSVLGALLLEPTSNPLEIVLSVSTLIALAYGAIRLTISGCKHDDCKHVNIKTLKNKIANLNECSKK